MVGLHRSAPRVARKPRRTAALLVATIGLLLLSAAWWAPAAPADVQPVTTAAAAQDAQELDALRYGPESQQLLELLLPNPQSFSGPYPVVVYLHSGGWIGGDRTALNDIAAEQLRRGYAVVSVDYRLATTSAAGTPVASFPGAIWDVKTAIRYLKVSARSLDLDPQRIVLMGSSAGGHLAAFVGATAGRFEPPGLPRPMRKVDSTVAAVVVIVGPSDLTTFEHTPHPWATALTAAFLGCPAPTAAAPYTCDESVLRTASVATYLDPSDPPIYLAYGAQDSLVVPATQGAPLAAAWVQAHCGDPAVASYHVVDDGHNVSPADVDATLDPWLDEHDSASAVRLAAGHPVVRTCRYASGRATVFGRSDARISSAQG
jgi:acetyl esterase/lipase